MLANPEPLFRAVIPARFSLRYCVMPPVLRLKPECRRRQSGLARSGARCITSMGRQTPRHLGSVGRPRVSCCAVPATYRAQRASRNRGDQGHLSGCHRAAPRCGLNEPARYHRDSRQQSAERRPVLAAQAVAQEGRLGRKHGPSRHDGHAGMERRVGPDAGKETSCDECPAVASGA